MTAIIKSSIWLALVAALPFAAQAATPTFNFYANGGPLIDETSITPEYIAGDLGVSISASVANVQGYVTERWDGLGVSNDDVLNVGEITQGESLVLSFNKAVSLSSLTFSMWENGIGDSFDHATLSWDNNTITLGNSNTGGASVKTFSLSNVVGTTFTITGIGTLTDFRLAGITATAAVPEASTFALMGLGLVGLGWVRRRHIGQA